jgi:hypothetical protein
MYRAHAELLASTRWRRAFNAGARPQRLLFAGAGTKDPKASDVLYVNGLQAPFTVDTVPENTLQAFADHGEVGGNWSMDLAESERVFEEFRAAGIDLDALGARLQDEGATAPRGTIFWGSLRPRVPHCSRSVSVLYPELTPPLAWKEPIDDEPNCFTC